MSVSSSVKASLKRHAKNSPSAFSNKPRVQLSDLEGLLAFNFKQIDGTQGQGSQEWHDLNLLLPMVERFRMMCSMNRDEACNNQANCMTVYDTFPSPSGFTHPSHVAEDASWASIHIAGKECLGGHIVANVFYVVFLDAFHEFAPTTRIDN